jgi:hypothetical protein
MALKIDNSWVSRYVKKYRGLMGIISLRRVMFENRTQCGLFFF